MFFHDHPLDLIFEAVQHTGADTLEFWPETPDWWLDGLPLGRLVQAVSSHPFQTPLSVHTPVLDLNPCSINPDVVQVSLEWACYSIKLAEDLGAAVCTLHPGRRTSKRPPTKADYHRLGNLLDFIEPSAENSAVRVSIENMEPKVNALLSTPREISHLLKEREWISFTLDACHVSFQGLSILHDFIAIADGRIANVHLSGATGDVLHQPISDNAWGEAALEALVDAGYNGLITLEINDLSVDKTLTYEEKICILARDVNYIRDF